MRHQLSRFAAGTAERFSPILWSFEPKSAPLRIAALLILDPVIVLFFLAQKTFIQGSRRRG